MSCNGESNMEEDSVICLDSSQESCVEDCHQTSLIEPINLEKTLPPGVAPDGFIVLDEAHELTDEETDESTSEQIDESSQKETPDFKVIFRDESISRRYGKKIKDFFRKLVSAEFNDATDNGSDDLVLEIWSRTKKKSNCDVEIMDHTLFIVDNTPGGQDKYNVPTYGKKFERVLKRSSENSHDEKNDKAAPRLNCFNCLGNHNMRDCPEPRNPYEINKNRKEFNVRMGPKNVRYHIDDDQRFKPGILSAELKKALGLASNELPLHIYKMRQLGYPPGWLEEAKLEHSGINLYNSDGRRELDPTEEVGEIFTPETKTQYDIRKVHEYPGFNIPAPEGTRDAYWCEEAQARHSKETMLETLSSRKADDGYKRKKLKRYPAEDSIGSSNSPVLEMEVEMLGDTTVETVSTNGHFVPPLPKTPIKTQAPPPPEPPSGDESMSEAPSPLPKFDMSDAPSRGGSPSLADLETRKKLLLEALDDSSLQSNPGTPSRSMNITNSAETPKSSYLNDSQSTPVQSNSDTTPKLGSVKSIERCTPILRNTSEFTKLPTSEKFSKDICDVINFENLPGYTGKYEKLSGLLNKVRETLNYERDDD